MTGPGLYHTPEAPMQFKAWVENVLNDWDFDNMCCAHIGNKIGGAHELLAQTLVNTQKTFDKLVEKYTSEQGGEEQVEKKPCNNNEDDEGGIGEDEVDKLNVEGNECG